MEPNEDGSYTIKGKIWRLPPNYKLHSVLGSGAYGCVCRCTNLDNSEEVAVKRIEDVFVSKTDALRILREVWHRSRVLCIAMRLQAPTRWFGSMLPA
eukprot:730428-Rhodomonas_salina.1